MTWCNDFCLACDQQTYGTAYCSQVCRLADLEISSPTTQSHSPSLQNLSSFPSYVSGQSPTYIHNVTTQENRGLKSNDLNRLSRSQPTAPHSLFGEIVSDSQSQSYHQGEDGLSPSSSQTSLSSIRSSSSSQIRLSEKTRNELKSYTQSFDQTRHLKRQRSLY